MRIEGVLDDDWEEDFYSKKTSQEIYFALEFKILPKSVQIFLQISKNW